MSNNDVLYEERKDASLVVINRPSVHNAIAKATLELLIAAVEKADRAKTAAIVITGAGGAAFSAGGDIQELAGVSREEGRRYLARFQDLLGAIRSAGKPVIARVDGFCLGGGNEIAISCDLVAASDRSTFGLAGLAIGAAPVLAATQILPRMVGDKRAREIIFLGERYTAEEARAIGWVNAVVPAAELDHEIESWCAKISMLSPQGLRIAKHALNAATDALAGAADRAADQLAAGFATEEFKEGVSAFLSKRRPDFSRFR
jgi:naphthoate synthase